MQAYDDRLVPPISGKDFPVRRLIHFALVFSVAALSSASAQITATIDIDTAVRTPVPRGFSGFNDEVSTPVEYYDYRFNALAVQLSPGWVRFPGGISSDPYNWKDGKEEPAWVAQLVHAAGTPPDIASLLQKMELYVAGKGGGMFIDAANRANLLGARMVVCVNAFTGSVRSVGDLAAYAKANGIPVAVWELANEPYLFTPGFFRSGADYVAQMRPYRDAIKAVDPNAAVAIFFDNAGNGNAKSAWDDSIAAYPDKYWDVVTYHQYPARSLGKFSDWVAAENEVLATGTNLRVTDYLMPMNPPGMRFLVSEFDPSLGSGLPPPSLTNGTLYGGIFVAEYTMRMSTVPSVLLVGSHALPAIGGVDARNFHYLEVQAAAESGTSIDTLTLNFDFYLSAQGLGAAIANSVLKAAVESNKTTTAGGLTVSSGSGQMPALYAQSYSDAAGRLSVLVTNKSDTAHQIGIRVNGSAPPGPFAIRFIAGTDGSTTNSASNPNAVAIQNASSGNPVTVPPYSVLRADIANPPVATFVNSASYVRAPLAAQQLVTAFGEGFSAQTIAAQSQPLPTMLGDTTILLTDRAGKVWMAPLLYVSPGQANFLLPGGIGTGAVSGKVMRNGAAVLTGSFDVAAVSPGIYAANGNGAGVAAATALRAGPRGTATLAVFSCQPGISLSCLSSPLNLGGVTDTVYVALYGTGIRGAGSLQAYVAGQAVPVLYFGAQQQYAGLDQINISIPRSLAGIGEASVYLIADGRMSNMVTVNIQ